MFENGILFDIGTNYGVLGSGHVLFPPVLCLDDTARSNRPSTDYQTTRTERVLVESVTEPLQILACISSTDHRAALMRFIS